jgi:hypothetical protein
MASEPPRDEEDDDARFRPPADPAPPAELELAEPPPPRRAPAAIRRPGGALTSAAPLPVEPATATRVAISLAALALAPFAALLPARWRRALHLEGLPLRLGALVQGFLQLAAAMITFHLLVQSVNERLVTPHLGAVLHAMEENQDALHFGAQATGVTTWIYVAVSWSGAACLYFLVEALARLAAVGATGDALPSGPLVLADVVGHTVVRWRAERRLPPLVLDEVSRDPGGRVLRIASCRARDWPRGTVLIVEGAAWAVEGVEDGAPARPFVYRFVPAPEGQVVRGRRVYRVDELLRPAGNAAAAPDVRPR